jgi:putative tryptophan/tyrosine transport system substrate-binding protein
VLAAFLFVLVQLTQAQQPTKIPRIGYLSVSSRSAMTARTEAFRQGLRELGYVEGKNIIIEWRSADGNEDRLPALAAELVQLKVDIIVTGGAAVTRPVKAETSTIPIVMTQDRDPVSSGFVASLARPGGNITGLSTLSPELSGKQLELLKETVPKLSRVAVFGTSTRPEVAQELKEVELAAGALGVKLQSLDIRSPKDFETAFQAAVKERAEAVVVRVSGPILSPHRTEVAALAVKSRLPVIYERAEEVEAGGLMSYGVSASDLDRRAATYVDKILKGAKPADLPVEQPTAFELVINLKTARALGLTISPALLFQATEVIR